MLTFDESMAPNVGDVYMITDNQNNFKIVNNGSGFDVTTDSINFPHQQVTYNAADVGIVNTIINTGITVSNIAGQHIFIGPHITDEEKKELESLEEELKVWKKHQELMHFKELSPELRQDIVNEAMTREAYRKMQDVKEEDFDHNDRLAELRNKNSPSIQFVGHAVEFGPFESWRFSGILNKFTLKELAEAHAEASLEEELSEDN